MFCNARVRQELEECQARCGVQECELTELRSALERHQRVSKLLVEEVGALRSHADNDRHVAEASVYNIIYSANVFLRYLLPIT